MILLCTLVQLLDWWQRLSNLWNAHWVEIMSSWMSCALMPLNFTLDYVWSRWYFGLSTTAAPLCSTYSICVSSISVSLHVSWRRTCHWWKRISNQIAFFMTVLLFKMSSVIPKQEKAKSTSLNYECMTKPARCAFNYLEAAFGYSLFLSSGECAWVRGSRKAVVTCFPSN